MKSKLPGKFIVLDGPDGCGKSTQVQMLYEWIKQKDIEVVTFRDPGTTAIGEMIRKILLNPEHVAMSVRTELLLYMAARAQLWQEKIKPALGKNKCVILDRWISSTCAYQGFAGEFGIEKVLQIAEVCLERIWPDLTVLLDVNLNTSATRLDRELDRMEQKGDQYHQKVRDGFLKLTESQNVIGINAAQSIEQVHREIITQIQKGLP